MDPYGMDIGGQYRAKNGIVYEIRKGGLFSSDKFFHDRKNGGCGGTTKLTTVLETGVCGECRRAF